MTTSLPRLTVGIATRNRPDELLRCVRSVTAIHAVVGEIVVIDDASDVSVEPGLRAALPVPFPISIRVIRFDLPDGYIVARNRIAREATTPYILFLDDDAFLLGQLALLAGLEIIDSDEGVAAVAFAQAEADGRPWPLEMQPSSASVPSEIPAYIGFAHILRREAFLAMGGYRECFHFYAEEKEFCLRLLDSGLKVVYLPDGRVAHTTSPVGRDSRKWLRFSTRNGILTGLFTFPALLIPVSFAWHTLSYFRSRRRHRITDPWSYGWVIKELVRLLPEVARSSRRVRYTTFKRWRGLRRNPVPYRSVRT